MRGSHTNTTISSLWARTLADAASSPATCSGCGTMQASTGADRMQTTARPLHAELGLSAEQALALYRTMLLARAVDERQWILQRQGRQAFVISCQGHEAAQVGSAAALRRGVDVMLPYYRDLAA